MTREEAIKEIEKAFEPAFANYIITALTEGATVSDKEPTTKNDLGVDREDAVERLNTLKQFIGYDKDSEIVKATQKSLDIAIKALEQEPFINKPCVSIGVCHEDKIKVLAKIRTEIIDEKDFAYADFDRYKEEVLGVEPDELPDDDFRFGMERAIEIIDKYMNDKCDKGCDFCEHTSECMPSKD